MYCIHHAVLSLQNGLGFLEVTGKMKEDAFCHEIDKAFLLIQYPVMRNNYNYCTEYMLCDPDLK